MSLRAIALVAVVGCGGVATTPSNAVPDASPPAEAAAPDAPPDPSCVLESASTLPGVSIRFAPQSCTFTLAQAQAGIAIDYDVVIDADVANVVPQGQTSAPAVGASGLDVLERLGGNGQSYCVCDVGLGAPISATPETLKRGVYRSTFQWDGHNWDGPSDTGNSKGPLFPAGTYRLVASASGTVAGTAFQVSAAFRVTLVP